jgi:hypothetical protein
VQAATTLVQRTWRRHHRRVVTTQKHSVATMMQAVWRGVMLRARFAKLKACALCVSHLHS